MNYLFVNRKILNVIKFSTIHWMLHSPLDFINFDAPNLNGVI